MSTIAENKLKRLDAIRTKEIDLEGKMLYRLTRNQEEILFYRVGKFLEYSEDDDLENFKSMNVLSKDDLEIFPNETHENNIFIREDAHTLKAVCYGIKNNAVIYYGWCVFGEIQSMQFRAKNFGESWIMKTKSFIEILKR